MESLEKIGTDMCIDCEMVQLLKRTARRIDAAIDALYYTESDEVQELNHKQKSLSEKYHSASPSFFNERCVEIAHDVPQINEDKAHEKKRSHREEE